LGHSSQKATLRVRFMRIELDSQDSRILKGLAISAIVFHNFFRFVSSTRQNEFTFDPARFQVFLSDVRHPQLAVQAIFSFWGHFGVQVFIFLSAYGLAKSHWNDSHSWPQFILGRVKKLFPIFGVVIVPWMLAACVLLGPIHFFKNAALEYALMPLGLSSLFGVTVPVGPWWFIPFILQFYAIWPWMRSIESRFRWQGLVILALACLGFTCIADPLLARWSVNLLETPIGRMPELCFGILAARYPIRIATPAVVLASAVLLFGSRYAALWPFSFMAALVLVLWAYTILRDRLRGSRMLGRIGDYSLLIFLLNALVANLYLRCVTSPASSLLWGFISATVTFAIAVFIHELVSSKPLTSNQMTLFPTSTPPTPLAGLTSSYPGIRRQGSFNCAADSRIAKSTSRV
jgi:peptidoglycan/LPS O-acetylase OafA/YrhL